MGQSKKSSRRVPCSRGINVEEVRRMRSMGSDLSRLGYDPYTIKLSKRLSSKSFYKFH